MFEDTKLISNLTRGTVVCERAVGPRPAAVSDARRPQSVRDRLAAHDAVSAESLAGRDGVTAAHVAVRACTRTRQLADRRVPAATVTLIVLARGQDAICSTPAPGLDVIAPPRARTA